MEETEAGREWGRKGRGEGGRGAHPGLSRGLSLPWVQEKGWGLRTRVSRGSALLLERAGFRSH